MQCPLCSVLRAPRAQGQSAPEGGVHAVLLTAEGPFLQLLALGCFLPQD